METCIHCSIEIEGSAFKTTESFLSVSQENYKLLKKTLDSVPWYRVYK